MRDIFRKLGLTATLIAGISHPAAALSIASPSCQDFALRQHVDLIASNLDRQNLLRISPLINADDPPYTLVLVDCWNDRMLEVLDPETLTYSQRAEPDASKRARLPTAEDVLNDAIESDEVVTFGELRRALLREGYSVQTGNYNKAPCGCELHDSY